MSRQLPYLAMDGVLCDRPQDGCFIGGKRNYARDNISNKETKMVHVMTNRETEIHAKKLVKRLLGQDSAMDDETAARIKEFLKGKLSAGDHETLCSMLDGDAEAQDTEPPPNDVDAKPRGQLAGDAKARDDFFARFPDAARIKLDNSNIQPQQRLARTSAADMASFNAMFPESKRIKLA